MIDEPTKIGQWIGLFLLGCLLFNFPILTVFNHDTVLWGIPLLYLYLFAVWLALVVSIGAVARSRPKTGPPAAASPGPSRESSRHS